MKAKKKTPKPVTLLTRIETLLSDVLEQCSVIEKSVEKNVLVLLRSAEESIAAAKNYFTAPEPPKVRQRTAKSPARVSQRRVTRNKVKATVTAKKRSVGHGARKVA